MFNDLQVPWFSQLGVVDGSGSMLRSLAICFERAIFCLKTTLGESQYQTRTLPDATQTTAKTRSR